MNHSDEDPQETRVRLQKWALGVAEATIVIVKGGWKALSM